MKGGMKGAARHAGAALGLGVVMAMALDPGIARAQNAAVSQLVQQAEFWDAKQRPELARDSWKRVLQSDADNAKALARLAALEEQAGNHAEAQEYLERLRKAAPNSPLLDQARKQMAGEGEAAISRARSLGRQGRGADALKVYEEAYGGAPAKDTDALEYYETMAGVDGRYENARDALGALAQRNAGDSRFELSYARVLTYRPAGRRDGIRRLQGLRDDPKLGNEARAAWRQALIWLEARPGDEPLYQDYLQTVGSDAELSRKQASLKEAGANAAAAQASEAAGAELARAFRSLDAGELDRAENGFERILARDPGNADARAGLGLIRLRQQRFNDATGLLDDAVRRKPALASRYREAQRTARFWSRAREGERAYEAGDLATAELRYGAAVGEPPASGADPTVLRAYATVLLENNKPELAEQQLRAGLAKYPQQPELLTGLAGILMRSGRSAEAGTLLAAAPESAKVELRGEQAEISRQQAAAMVRAGRNDEAERLLRDALVTAPESPWVRLDLARLYRRIGRDAEAESLLSALTEVAGDGAQAHLAQAYSFAESQRWYETLVALEQIPPADRVADARKLQREAWVRYQVQRATLAAQRGDPGQAAEWLGAAVNAAGDDPQLASALAQGWAALGDPARAVAVLRKSFAARGEPSADDRIQYAALLLQIDQDAEFEAVSTTLIQRGGLSPLQARTLEDLIVGYRIKLADRERERGNYAAAYRQLREVVARYPDQPRVQMALSRLFASAGEPEKSLAIGKALLKQESAKGEPSDEVLFAAIDSALAAKDEDNAARWIDQAFQRGSDPVAAHRAAARLADQRGRKAEALGHYREADLLVHQQDAYGAAPPDLLLIDPASGSGSLLPDPIRDSLKSEDVPIGPLLPRAPEGGSLAPLPSAARSPAAGVQPSAAPFSGATQSDAKAAEPRNETRFSDGRARVPAADSQWIAPYDPTRVLPIDRLEAEVSGWGQGLFQSRNRDGEAGLSRLFDLETPIDWSSRMRRAGRVGLRIRPVYLDAGNVSGINLLRYGTLALTRGELDGETPALDQSDSGIAVSGAYKLGSFTVDIGTTPLGFQIESIVGGLLWTPSFGDLSLALDVSRRAITDSLLSYAGAFDPLTGRDWGGVTRSGARVDLAYDFGGYGLYGNGGYYSITGRNVEENSQMELGGGLFVRAYQGANNTLTVGLNITTFSYDKNLRYYTLGHGGYFSPEYFGAITVPTSFTGRRNDLSYRLDIALGIQSFREDGMPLFPGRQALQDEVEALAEFEPAANIPTGYGSQKNSGLSYRFGGAAQYRLTPHLSLGGTLSADNARDFEELILMGFLRYYFTGVQAPPSEPLIPGVFKGPLP